jgi:hypothetical protein
MSDEMRLSVALICLCNFVSSKLIVPTPPCFSEKPLCYLTGFDT